jgi:hypothetical protein
VVTAALAAQEDLVVPQTEALAAQEDLVVTAVLQETEALAAQLLVVIVALMVKEIFLELAAPEVLVVLQMAVTAVKQVEAQADQQTEESEALVVTVAQQTAALVAKVA